MAADGMEQLKAEWGSDVMVDAIRAMGLPYLSLNPGSSYRGLHDSLVNYAANEMEMLCCPHEKIAVGLAHGYAKASGPPMGVILHNVVGLLHGAMGIYYAYIDRVPVLVFGGSGLAMHDRRRPNIDWIHSADVQGNAVRDFTKWDHEPRSIADMPGTLARAYRVAMSEPRGPVYIALDAGLQETRLDEPVPLPDFGRRRAVPARARSAGPEPAGGGAVPGPAAGHRGRVRGTRPAGVRAADRTGRTGRDRGGRHRDPAQLPQPPSAVRHRDRRTGKRRLCTVPRRQGHGQAHPAARLDQPDHHLPARAGYHRARSRLQRPEPVLVERGLRRAGGNRRPGHRGHGRGAADAAGGLPPDRRRGLRGPRRAAPGLRR